MAQFLTSFFVFIPIPVLPDFEIVNLILGINKMSLAFSGGKDSFLSAGNALGIAAVTPHPPEVERSMSG